MRGFKVHPDWIGDLDVSACPVPWTFTRSGTGFIITDNNGAVVLASLSGIVNESAARLMFCGPHGVALAQAVLIWDADKSTDNWSDMLIKARNLLVMAGEKT